MRRLVCTANTHDPEQEEGVDLRLLAATIATPARARLPGLGRRSAAPAPSCSVMVQMMTWMHTRRQTIDEPSKPW